MTLETLRWGVWTAENQDFTELPAADVILTKSVNSSIGRSTSKLADSDPKQIEIEERKLTSTEEFLVHYPNKTFSARLRFLRQKLLPILLDNSNPEFYSRYSRGGNEAYLLEKRESKPILKRAGKIWQKAETELMDRLPGLSDDSRRALFLLIAKGKQLFLSEELTAKGGFVDYADTVRESNILPPHSMKLIDDICEIVLPKLQEQHLNLKSKLYSLVNFGGRRISSSLKTESVQWLYSRCPDLLTKLNEFKAPEQPKDGAENWMIPVQSKDVGSPELDKLIDATALQPFRFLTILR